MIPTSRSTLLRLAFLVLMASALVSCSSTKVGNGAKITKVKYYHLISGRPTIVADPAINLEREHILYGAVTKADMLARTGHYYTLFWKVADRTQPVTVRFEYRQANSGLVTKVKELEIIDIQRSNSTRFQVIGPDYVTQGRVSAWKMSIIRGKQELVSSTSNLWN